MTTCSKVCVTLWVRASYSKPSPCQVGSDGPFGSGNIADLIFCVRLQDQAIKESCDFKEGSFSFYISTLPNFVAIGIVVLDI